MCIFGSEILIYDFLNLCPRIFSHILKVRTNGNTKDPSTKSLILVLVQSSYPIKGSNPALFANKIVSIWDSPLVYPENKKLKIEMNGNSGWALNMIIYVN